MQILNRKFSSYSLQKMASFTVKSGGQLFGAMRHKVQVFILEKETQGLFYEVAKTEKEPQR